MSPRRIFPWILSLLRRESSKENEPLMSSILWKKIPRMEKCFDRNVSYVYKEDLLKEECLKFIGKNK